MNDELLQRNFISKRQRYKVGFIIYLIYLMCQVSMNIYFHIEPSSLNVPFTETYIHMTSMSLILIFWMIKEKIQSKRKKAERINNFYNNFFYFYHHRRNRDVALMDTEEFEIYLEEQFQKKFHKIVISLMLLLYASLSCKMKSLEYLTIKSENSIYITISLITTLFLRRHLLLHTEANNINLTATLLSIAGIILIFIYQILIYLQGEITAFMYSIIYSIIGGISFGVFVSLIKYHHTVYGIKFNITLISGFIGLYSLIVIPLLLFFVFIFSLEVGETLQYENIYIFIIFILINGILSNLLSLYSIIYLSPLVFMLGFTLTVPASIIFELILHSMSLSEIYIFLIGCGLLVIGFSILFIDKYKKIKERMIEKEYNLFNNQEENRNKK